MTTKALFVAALGSTSETTGSQIPFVRTSGNVLTAAGHGLVTGSGPYRVRTSGTVPAGLVNAVRASKIYTPSTDIENQTVTVDGKVYTWKNTPTLDGEVDVNATASIAAENLAAAINIGPGAGTAYGIAMTPNPRVTATAVAAGVFVQAVSLDAAIGNAIPVAKTAAGSWAADAVLLSGGVSGTDYYAIRLTDDTFSLATSRELANAGTAVAITTAGTGTHTLLGTASAMANALERVLLDVLTHPGMRTMPAEVNIAKFWESAIEGVAV